MPTTVAVQMEGVKAHTLPWVLSGAFSLSNPCVAFSYLLSGRWAQPGRACPAGTSPAPPPLSGEAVAEPRCSAAMVPVLAGAGSTTGSPSSSWAVLVPTGVSLNRGQLEQRVKKE